MADIPVPPEHDAADIPQRRRSFKVILKLVVGLGILATLVAFSLPVTRHARPASHRSQCSNNLKQIALALHTYEADYKSLPPAYTVDATGKPLHSWRTLILPYLDQGPLYQTIDLTKPWNDPANAEAYNTQLLAFRCPAVDIPANHTTYLAIVAPGSCLRAAQPRPLSEITDSKQQTLLVMEVAAEQAVHWMAPFDADEHLVLAFGPRTKLPHSSGMAAALADGSIRFLPADLSAASRRALISIAGNDNLPPVSDN